jgi:hypothetical protein
MRNILDKSCRENKNTHFTFNNYIFFENHAVYEMRTENVAEPEGPQVTSQYGKYGSCMLDKQTYMHARTRTHSHTNM